MIWYHGTDFVPLFDIVAMSLPQPSDLRLLPGPPVYTFWGHGKPPWLGGPKAHARHYISIHVRFASHRCPSFWFTWKWDFATLPLDTCTHDTRYTCPGSSSGLMILKGRWWCTMALPSATVHLLSLPPNWIYDNLRPAVPVTPVPPDLLLWADRPLSGRTDFSK